MPDPGRGRAYACASTVWLLLLLLLPLELSVQPLVKGFLISFRTKAGAHTTAQDLKITLINDFKPLPRDCACKDLGSKPGPRQRGVFPGRERAEREQRRERKNYFPYEMCVMKCGR